MINGISSWARQVILAVLIAIILEMLFLKNSKNTKYVKTVIGIYIMYVIIAPGLKIINKGAISFSNVNYIKEDTHRKMEIYTEKIDIKETYELKLKQDIEEKLRIKGYIVSNIKLDLNLNSDSNSYGEIKKMEIKLSKKDTINVNNEKNITVEKIKIKNLDNSNDTYKETEEELKAFLRQEYGVENIIFK